MKVLFVPFNYKNHYFPMAGVFVEEQIKALQQKAVDVRVLNVVAIPLPKAIKMGVRALGYQSRTENGVAIIQYLFPAIPKLPKLTQWLREVIQKRLAKRLLKTWQPDVCHVHMFPGGGVARWLKQAKRIPYVVTEHLSGFAEERYDKGQLQVAKQCYQDASERIAVSQHLANTLHRSFQLSFQVLPNCVDTAFFVPQQAAVTGNIKRLINIGRMVEVKNQLGLLHAFAEANLPQEVTLTLIGDGPLKTNIEDKIQELGLIHRVQLLGQLNKTQIRDQLAAHDAFVLSSHYETFGVVLIEAMSMGLPVLSTPCQGASEIITDARVGFICDDKHKLAESLCRFVSLSFESNVIRQHVLTHYSYDHVSDELVSLYQASYHRSQINGAL
ncbi:glycosyltransferase [Alteromonas sp. a30]|uniref:glycosyltransferase n=1 Tax=Alteromonas sp. a30 TaxID=2730917 RepID=UPI0022822422|nr:glycosyltransferase [Alteromonas sp. a30]MCY7294388.1 glycosyltransferase [Alteromonas sp. a30]